MDDARSGVADFAAYCRAHIARRRAEPGDDVFSGLVHAEHEGRRLTDEELGGWWQLLVTTRNLLNPALCPCPPVDRLRALNYWLGANLARTEAQIYFGALAPRRRLERSGHEARLRTTHFNGFKHLPIGVKWAEA